MESGLETACDSSSRRYVVSGNSRTKKLSPSASTVHIVASCADRKRTGLTPEVQLRSIRGREPEERLERWWSALSAQGGSRIAARDLYVGPYWSTVRDLPKLDARRGLNTHMWVASAGYGLVPESAAIRPYSATFRANVADSVVRSDDARRGFRAKMWWEGLARKPLLGWKGPRRISALAKKDPRASILVIGSAGYISAMEDDLMGVLEVHGSSERLVIVSGDPGVCRDELRASWVESNARLQPRVGGSLPALHARVAREILNEAPRFGLRASALKARWARISERSPELTKPVRTPSSDDDVKSFIRESLHKDPSLKHTRLLRELRSGGRACEQARFRDLFQQVVREQSR